MKLKLPDSISSTQEVTSLVLEVREYAKWFSHAVIMKKMNNKKVPNAPTLSASANEMLRNWANGKSLTRQNLDELIATLEKFKRSSETMTIVLAAPATNDIKRQLVAWCRKNVSDNILVTFQFNATLLGGMVVRYGSRIFDWSFRRKILANRGHFPEVLRNV
jgi:uncharacterized protein YejL (UPF0352 family)